MNKYTVRVTRDGKWWMVAIPELDGLTQARRLAEAESMARDYIAVTLDIPGDSFTLDIEIDGIGSVIDVSAKVRRIHEERAQAAELERKASAEAEELAKALVAESVPLRDVGAILEVSHQRAHQLVSA